MKARMEAVKISQEQMRNEIKAGRAEIRAIQEKWRPFKKICGPFGKGWRPRWTPSWTWAKKCSLIRQGWRRIKKRCGPKLKLTKKR
jgi:hypothetical protein